MIEQRTQTPFMGVWFGNFYKPAFDDRAFIDSSMRQLREMGFNSIELDSKAWEDFADRYAGQEASPYVAQQEYMMQAARREGMSYHFLALYLNGDNLYPNIRFSPPIYGESVANADGSDGRWYKYWSSAAKDSMVAHVQGLHRLYMEDCARISLNGETRIPLCSMWDPIVAPSFDEEGRARYLTWLEKRYGSIAGLNSAYGTAFRSFDEMQPADYWHAVRHGENACYTEEDLRQNTPAFRMWADNMMWRSDELTAYFADMNGRLHAVDPRFYLMPNMAQWSYFLNVDASKITGIGFSDLWDTAMRGLDLFRLSPHVDMDHFFTVPVTPQGDGNAYVVSCQHAMIRAMNRGRPFLGGIYWGRFLYNDIYAAVSPCEVVASIVASGASGISAYGCCGMDDGGLLHRMDEGFTSSLSVGNAWAKRVIPQLGQRRTSRIALLFPAAMSLLEPLRVAGAEARRLDLLGLYALLCDAGFAPDIIHPDEAAHLADYDLLLLPCNDCYAAMPDAGLEHAVREFTMQGGTVVHGAWDELARRALGVVPRETAGTCYTYRGEGGLLLKAEQCAYDGERLAAWRDTDAGCIVMNRCGKGRVYSFGFLPGYQYAARTCPHVPLAQRNEALYPFTHMAHNPLSDILADCLMQPITLRKGVEMAEFANGRILINHTGHPIRLAEGEAGDFQYPVDGCTLIGHSAVFIKGGNA